RSPWNGPRRGGSCGVKARARVEGACRHHGQTFRCGSLPKAKERACVPPRRPRSFGTARSQREFSLQGLERREEGAEERARAKVSRTCRKRRSRAGGGGLCGAGSGGGGLRAAERRRRQRRQRQGARLGEAARVSLRAACGNAGGKRRRRRTSHHP